MLVGRQSTVYHHTYIVAYCQALTVKVWQYKEARTRVDGHNLLIFNAILGKSDPHHPVFLERDSFLLHSSLLTRLPIFSKYPPYNA